LVGDAVNTESIREALLDWFDLVGSASLKLPTGWFGRPHDNQHRLTSSHVLGDRLVIELDGQTVLMLAHPTTAEVDGACRRVSGFTHGVWDWDEYGSGRPRLQTFAGGTVEFHGSGEQN
jgi:hypothetical protein